MTIQSLQEVFDQSFHPSLPQYVNGLSTRGAVITDRELTEHNLREAAFAVICLQVSNRLEDEQQEDESADYYLARQSMFEEVNQPQCDIVERIRHLLPEFPDKEVESVYQKICECLVIDASRMGAGRFRDFAILLNRYDRWTSYAAALNGEGICPKDELEIDYWMRDNDVELSDEYHEIGFDEGIVIASRLIEMELNQDG